MIIYKDIVYGVLRLDVCSFALTWNKHKDTLQRRKVLKNFFDVEVILNRPK